jgi:hypothetical protein
MSGFFSFIDNDLYRAACECGSTFSRKLILKNDDATLRSLVGYSASMQVRPSVESSTVVFDLSTGNGKISINSTDASITLTISAAETASAIPGMYVYDLKIIDASTKAERLLEGQFEVTAAVTR